MRTQVLLIAFLICGLCCSSISAQRLAGKASYYNASLHGNQTSIGERYDHQALTCASTEFPVGTILRVTRTDNGRSVDVRVNDCGPINGDRIIDVSGAAATALDMVNDGVVIVQLAVIRRGTGRMPCGSSFTPSTSQVESYDQAQGEPRQLQARGGASPVGTNGTYRADAFQSIDTGYGVQVASFRSYANAERRVGELRTQGFSQILIRVNGDVHQVILGPFETEGAANEYRRNLRSRYQISGFVTSLGAAE